MRTVLIILILFLLHSCNTNNTWVCATGNCEDGYGVKIWDDNGLEKGYWVNGELNGKGFQFLGRTSEFSGDTYSGEFKNNQYEGRGTYYSKREDATYVGELKNGKFNGKGKIIWGKNSKFPSTYYDGEWKEGLMHGQGTKFWGKNKVAKYANCKYIGEWKNNEQNGLGKFEWSDGSYYEGTWTNGKQDGDGIYVFKNGEVFRGYWDKGYCEALAKKLKRE